MLQLLSSTTLPTHSFPPCSGAGLLQLRNRSWNPPPHSLLHLPHSDQFPQPPSIGQCCSKQSLVCTDSPWHSFPPCAGAGLSHTLCREVVPFPHVFEQLAQVFQAPHSPSIGQGSVLQNSTSCSRPWQLTSTTRTELSGCMQRRDRLLLPEPHERLHGSHSDHSDKVAIALGDTIEVWGWEQDRQHSPAMWNGALPSEHFSIMVHWTRFSTTCPWSHR